MIHEVSAPGAAAHPYFKRYTEDALSYAMCLSAFASHAKASTVPMSSNIFSMADYCDNFQYVSGVVALRVFLGAPDRARKSSQRANSD